MCVTWLINMCDMTHSYVWRHSFSDLVIFMYWHDSFENMCDMTHSYMRHNSFICGTQLYVGHSSFIIISHIWISWFSNIGMTHSIHMCDMTHSYMRHNSFICGTSFFNMWDTIGTHFGTQFIQHNISYGVATIGRLLKIIGLFCKRALQKRLYSAKETYDFKEPTNRSYPIFGSREFSDLPLPHSYVWQTSSQMWHDSFICVTWLLQICDMTPSYVWHDSFICVTWLLHMILGTRGEREGGVEIKTHNLSE